MIFSESRRFIFFAVPKTGTHTIREAVRVHLAEGDWEQQLRYGKRYPRYPRSRGESWSCELSTTQRRHRHHRAE